MSKIDDIEMKKINGGGLITLGLGKIALIVFGVTFVGGIIDGFIRPLKCN